MSLRRRMTISLLSLAVVPLAIGLVILFFIVSDDIAKIEGKQLSDQAIHLANRFKLEMERSGSLVNSAENIKKAMNSLVTEMGWSSALLDKNMTPIFSSGSTPLPPTSHTDSGWISYKVSDKKYFAGISKFNHVENGALLTLHVAIIQPSENVYNHFYSVTRQLALLIILFGIIVVILARKMSERFVQPILEIRRGAEIVSKINLGHRIKLDSGDELEDLAIEFNHMAENLAKTYDQLEERVNEATRKVNEERNRLATVLRTMVDGVIVTNVSSEIILMNPKARLILAHGYTTGIGTPLNRIFPSERLQFYLRRLGRKTATGRELVEEVIFPLPDGKLIKGSLSGVPGPDGSRSGYLLVFQDISAPSGDMIRLEETLREMPLQFKGPLATSRSLIETLQRHREMSPEKQQQFLNAASQEIERMTSQVAALEEASSASRSVRWPANICNPIELLNDASRGVPGLEINFVSDNQSPPLIMVEPFSWTVLLEALLKLIKGKGSAATSVDVDIHPEEASVITTLVIRGASKLSQDELESLMLAPVGETGISLGKTVRKNRGELWIRTTEEHQEIRLALQQASAAAGMDSVTGLYEDEPAFYDFDLFIGRSEEGEQEILGKSLTELDYVVLDTETTGLNLSYNDKIISISAIRIRNGKIQPAEIFNTLVNPERSIPAESTKIHHIEDHMVATAPTIKTVYPQFAEFVGGAIIVAHNAAFDKKALDVAAQEAGCPQLDNHILDTLFLSYALHNETKGHGIDHITERLGITIEGRHTSLGDARATAQAFLGLLKLLPGRGVNTLGEAKGFCDKYLLLRWQSSKF